MDYLIPTGGTLDFRTLELSMNGVRVKCIDTRGGEFCARVVVHRTTTIPAGHEVIVPGRAVCRAPVKGYGILEPVDRSEVSCVGVVVARTLTYYLSESSRQVGEHVWCGEGPWRAL